MAAASSPETLDALYAVEALCLSAGRAIMKEYQNPSAVESKADQSPVTAADRAAHTVLVEGLQRHWPGVPVISEESDVPSFETRRSWTRFWLVDPLDGTREYIKRNGEFTVNVALIDDGVPVLGVVHAPVIDMTYGALRGNGAWRKQNGNAREPIHARDRDPDAPLVVVESRSHPSEKLERWLAGQKVAKRVSVGSSLKMCWVADGQADVYPRFGPTMEWDVAAGDCVYRNAGGTDAHPSPLRYNKPDLRNGDFILGFGMTQHVQD